MKDQIDLVAILTKVYKATFNEEPNIKVSTVFLVESNVQLPCLTLNDWLQVFMRRDGRWRFRIFLEPEHPLLVYPCFVRINRREAILESPIPGILNMIGEEAHRRSHLALNEVANEIRAEDKSCDQWATIEPSKN